jgi:hypothetical protein
VEGHRSDLVYTSHISKSADWTAARRRHVSYITVLPYLDCVYMGQATAFVEHSFDGDVEVEFWKSMSQAQCPGIKSSSAIISGCRILANYLFASTSTTPHRSIKISWKQAEDYR